MRTRYRAPFGGHQRRQHVELGWRQGNGMSLRIGQNAGGIIKRPSFEPNRRTLLAVPSKQTHQAGDQLSRVERLYQIVIDAKLSRNSPTRLGVVSRRDAD